MTLFTVQLELGPETRALIEKVATTGVVHLELGPDTRETIEALFRRDPERPEGLGPPVSVPPS